MAEISEVVPQPEWFRVALASIGDAVLTTDVHSRITFLNAVAESMTGWSLADAAGRALSEVFHIVDEETRAPADNPIKAALASGTTVAMANHTVLISRDGTEIGIEDSAAPIRGTGSEIVGAVMVFHDVTRRREAERERRNADELRNRLAAVVESSDDAIITKTLDGVITTWNPGAERIFGYTASEAIGQPVTMLMPADHVDEEPAILARLRRGERIEHYETVRQRKDGRLLDISLTVSPLKDYTGRIIGASKVARDITRQKEAATALREHAQILTLLNQTGRSIASNLELQSVLQTVTDTARELTGAQFGAFFYNVTDAAGESFLLYTLSGASRESFDSFGLPRNTPVFNHTFTGQGIVRSGDITKDARYGQLAPHYGMPAGHLPVRSYLAVPVIARTGAVIGGLFFGHPQPDMFSERAEQIVLGVAAQASIAMDNARLYEAAQREIASRQAAEETLRQTDRRKDEFLATLAHELRNPLAPIRQATTISQADDATEAQKRWSHQVISRQVRHMSLLLDDLLDVSRITRGTLELRPEMTELSAIVEAAVETARPALDARRHRLVLDLPQEPLRFAADPLRLAQVLSNLLTNAAKYTDPAGRIVLRARTEGEAILIGVQDNGVGLAGPALTEVFQMFSQVQGTQHRSEGGLGIGLALSRGLMALHGGTIEARSAGPGKGSEFIVRLPRRMLETQTPGATARDRSVATIERRVLVADDIHDAAESLAMLLQMDGHDVTVVHDGEAALAAILKLQPQVAILDIGMPGLSGYEVASRVRGSGRNGELKLIAVTGWGQESDKSRALAAGFDHHFTKPIDTEQLGALLQK
jgi:PAS domain S-box-containing protein